MNTIDPAIIKRAAETWRKHCNQLEIKIDAPFTLNVNDLSLSCIAFLPDFGSPNGMIIGAMDLPEISSDNRVLEWTRQKGLFCSFVNASAFAKAKIADRIFKEALEDWGYYGSQTDCPPWFNGYKGGKSLP